MKFKILFLFLMASVAGWGQYSYTFLSKEFDANNQTKTLGSADWTLVNNGDYYGYDLNKGQQVGSASKPATSMSLSTSDISGTITSVKISTSGAASVVATVSVSVGGTNFGSPQTITANNTEYTFSGSNSGAVVISWNQTSSKALYFKKIEVTYSSCTPPTPTFIVAPATDVCKGASVTYTTQSGKTNYVWSIPGTSGTDYDITAGGTGTSSNTVTLTWLTGGSKTVTVGYTEAGCASTTPASNTITVKDVSIAPVATQNIYVNADGTQLNATMYGTPTSRVWKYSTTSGSEYVSFSPAQTGTTYTPNFNTADTYYVVCETVFDCGTILSNEIQVNVTAASFSGVTAGAGTEPDTISSLVNTQAASSLNFDFTVTDDAVTTNGNDNLPTLITQIVIAQGTGNDIANWTQAIAGAELTDGTNTMTGTVNSGNITFGSINTANLGRVIDGSTKTYTLKIWLNTIMGGSLATTVDDLNLAFSIDRSNFTTPGSATSTQFETGTGTAVQSGSTKNEITVVATQLNFAQQPTDTGINSTMSPAVTVSANDANGNRDRNFTGLVEITSDGTMTGDPVGVNAVNGLATFGSLVHTATGTGLQLLAVSGAWGDMSAEFDIVTASYIHGAFLSSTGTGLLYTNASTWSRCNPGPCTGTTAGAGNWGAYGASGQIPSAGSTVIIQGEVTLSTALGVTNSTILSGGNLIVENQHAVSGEMKIKSGGTVTNNDRLNFQTSAVFKIEDGGNLILDNYQDNPNISGAIWGGNEVFAANSNVYVNYGKNDALLFTPNTVISTNPSTDSKFGNLYIQPTTYYENGHWSSPGIFPNGTYQLTKNDLIVNAADRNLTLNGNGVTIGKDMILNSISGQGDIVTISSNSSPNTLTVKGNLIKNGTGVFRLNGSGTHTLIIEGDLNINNGELRFMGFSPSTFSNLNLKGDLNITNSGNFYGNNSAINFNQFNFSGTGDGSTPETTQNISVLNTATASNIAFKVNSGAHAKLDTHFNLGGASTMTVNGTFDADDKVLSGTSGSQSLTVANNGTFKTANLYYGFSGDNNASVAATIETIDLQDGSTVNYYAEDDQFISTQTNVGQGTEGNYYNLKISGSGDKIPYEKTLTVNNISYVTSGTLLIPESDDDELPYALYALGGIDVEATGTLLLQNNAVLMQNPGAVNTGSITQLRNANVPWNQYNYWSSPVKDQPLYTLYDNGLVVPTDRVMVYNPETDYFKILKKINNPLSKFGEGYSIKGPASNPTGEVSAKFIGTPNNEASGMNTIAVATYITDGDDNNFNLIGNPFPSNLNLNLLYEENEDIFVDTVDDSTPGFYFWDNVGNTAYTQQGPEYEDYYQNNYAVYNPLFSGGTAAAAGPDASGKKPNGIVKPGQGFIINVKQGETFLTVNNAMRTSAIKLIPTDGDAVYFKNGNNSPASDEVVRNDKFWLELVNPINGINQIAIGYFKEADNAFDNYDSKIMDENVSDNIYTMSKDAVKLTIQGREGNFKNTDMIPLGVKFFVKGKYKIQLEETKGIFKNHQDIYLKDKYLGAIHNLSDNGYYDFEGLEGEFNDRFEIVFQDGSTPSGPVLTTASQNKINILKRDNRIEISSSRDKIIEVEIFNLSGWSIYKIAQVNQNTLRIPASLLGKQIIIVKIETETGEIQTKKFVNQ